MFTVTPLMSKFLYVSPLVVFLGKYPIRKHARLQLQGHIGIPALSVSTGIGS
jgi:hypothetical protein